VYRVTACIERLHFTPVRYVKLTLQLRHPEYQRALANHYGSPKAIHYGICRVPVPIGAAASRRF
jgi:hypothetical protein